MIYISIVEKINKDLQKYGFGILENWIDINLISAVKHRIDLDLFSDGISKRELLWWDKAANWFPHLRFDPLILELQNFLPECYKKGTPCEPQILIGLPNWESYEPTPHIDKEPDWANDKKYKLIIGVPLTKTNKENGGIRIQALDGKEYSPTMNAGDVLIMNPKIPHSGGPNLTGGARYAIYFRWLE